MRLFEHLFAPGWAHASLENTLRPAGWALAITVATVALLFPQGLQAQLPQNEITTNADGAASVYAADLDGDSDKDVLSASQFDDKIAWYENTGSGFSAQNTITTNANRARSVYAADLDGDSDKDVLSASQSDDKIAWYENTGSGFSAQNTITTNADDARSVYAADLDGDGDKDVLSASFDDDKIAWYENTSSGFSGQNTITTNARQATSVYAADLDGDSDKDVLSASAFYNKIAWYENTDSGFSAQNTITTNAGGAESVYAANLDGDGDKDVLSASYDDDKIAWYENLDSGDFSAQNTITTNASRARSVYAADLDGDGDKDVLSASLDDDKIAWYENTSSTLPVELTSLKARVGANGVQLTWQTASETGNAGFYVQHRSAPAGASENGSQAGWTRLGFVEGSGTTSKPQSYQFKAEGLGPGTHKFRLRQVDTDGTAHLSKAVTAEIQMQEKVLLKAPAPNPVQTTARLTFAVKKQEKATVTLYNTLGQQVATVYEGRPTPGEQVSRRLNASALGSGAYIVRLEAGGSTKTRKVVVVR